MSSNSGTSSSDRSLSVVVPTFNEANNISPLLDRLLPVLRQIGYRFEVIFVDDGSRDNTAQLIGDLSERESAIKLVRFSRNFGKEAALNAGLAHAQGDAVIQLDADLQHPPEMIAEFVREWERGGEIVYGARQSRESDGFVRRILTKAFYRIFSAIADVKLMEGLGDFLLLDRKVVQAILALPERERFAKGLYAWVGFRSVAVPFNVAPRLNGQSGWGGLKLFRFAMDALTAFGSVPLKVWSYVGLFMSMSALAYACYIVYERLVFGNSVPGYPSLMAAICFFAGIQLLGLGIVGEYLSRVLSEVKQRPLYLVSERVGFSDQEQSATANVDEKKVGRIAS